MSSPKTREQLLCDLSRTLVTLRLPKPVRKDGITRLNIELADPGNVAIHNRHGITEVGDHYEIRLQALVTSDGSNGVSISFWHEDFDDALAYLRAKWGPSVSELEEEEYDEDDDDDGDD